MRNSNDRSNGSTWANGTSAPTTGGLSGIPSRHTPVNAVAPLADPRMHAGTIHDSRDDERDARSPAQIAKHAVMLLGGKKNPLTREGRRELRLREVPHFYSSSVVGHVTDALHRVVENGGRMYLQGRQTKVGTSLLIADYVTAFNLFNERNGDGRQILHVNIAEGTDSVRRFLDDVAAVAQVPLSLSDLSSRGRARLTQQLAVGMRTIRACTLVLDHVHFLGPKVLPFLKTVIDATDPATTGGLARHANNPADDRLGVVLVSHFSPRHLLERHKAIRYALRGCHVVLGPYATVEAIAEAVIMADIGITDVSFDNPSDVAFVERVLQLTAGSPAAMEPLFQILDAISLKNDRARPDCDMLDCALEYYAAELIAKRRPGTPTTGDAQAQAAGEIADALLVSDRDAGVAGDQRDKAGSRPGPNSDGETPQETENDALDPAEVGERARQIKAMNRQKGLNRKVQRNLLRGQASGR